MEEIINRCKSGLLQVIKKSDDKALGILRIYHKSLYDYIHNTLCSNGEEEKVRELISYHVIGNFQAPRYSGVLRLIKDRMKELPYDEKSREIRLQYYEEYRKFLALAAFRSLKHFALYMENSPNGILHETMDIMSGWYYYATKMVLDKSVNFILKQMPTGMGKCLKSDTPILTSNGVKAIKDIVIGDEVYSMKNNELVLRRVSNKWNTYKKQVKIITRSGVEIIASPEHRMYTDKGYIPASALTAENYLYKLCTPIDSNNHIDDVEKFNKETDLLNDVIYKDFVWDKISRIEYIDEYTEMVDIEVEDTHNFIANGYVSHNSYSDVIMIAWLLGYNPEAQVVKIFGNSNNVSPCFNGICSLIKSKKFGEIFPKFACYNGMDTVFSYRREKPCTMKLDLANKVSLQIYGKESDIDGIRTEFLFLDDITQASDIANIDAHNKDINRYERTWQKRRYDDNNFFIVAGGTTYSVFDIISYLKRKFGGEKAVKSKINRYTTTAVPQEITKDGIAAFISVPSLDPINDESTYPQKYSTFKLRKMREDDYKGFMAMNQQTPLPPDGTPFHFDNLSCYDTLPSIGVEGRADFCYASLDGKRKGGDFCAMPIFTPIDKKFYLIDCIYDDRPMKDLYDYVIMKIKQHHIIKLVVENNIDVGIKTLLEEKMAMQGINYCEIIERYNTMNKDVRIARCEFEIKQSMAFPKFGMYARSSPMGRALEELYTYSYTAKNIHDDFTDAISSFIMNFGDSMRLKTPQLCVFSR